MHHLLQILQQRLTYYAEKKQLNYNTETVFAEDKHTASNEQN